MLRPIRILVRTHAATRHQYWFCLAMIRTKDSVV
jgi:hypothetical protein